MKKRDHKVEEAMELLKERDMPLPSYTWTHADARLTEAQRTLLAQYFEGLSSELNEGRDH